MSAKVEIVEGGPRGRYLRATRDLVAGEEAFAETATMAWPYPGRNRCSYSFVQASGKGKLVKCTGCGTSYLSREQQELDLGSGHKDDCAVVRKNFAHVVNSTTGPQLALALARVWNDAKLRAHTESLFPGFWDGASKWMQDKCMAWAVTARGVAKFRSRDLKQLAKIQGQLIVSMKEVTDFGNSPVGRGYFPELGAFVMPAEPRVFNCTTVYDLCKTSRPVLRLVTLRAVAAGEPLTVSYGLTSPSWLDRRVLLDPVHGIPVPPRRTLELPGSGAGELPWRLQELPAEEAARDCVQMAKGAESGSEAVFVGVATAVFEAVEAAPVETRRQVLRAQLEALVTPAGLEALERTCVEDPAYLATQSTYEALFNAGARSGATLVLSRLRRLEVEQRRRVWVAAKLSRSLLALAEEEGETRAAMSMQVELIRMGVADSKECAAEALAMMELLFGADLERIGEQPHAHEERSDLRMIRDAVSPRAPAASETPVWPAND